MTGAIRFQCTFWMRPNWHGKAHACGATFGSLNEYVRHYHERHDIVGQERRRTRAADAPKPEPVKAEAQ